MGFKEAAHRKYLEFHLDTAGHSSVALRITTGKFLAT